MALRYSITVGQEPVARAPAKIGDHRDDRQQEAADQRLEDRAPGQPELILQLPQHVGRRGPGRHREVDEEEDEDRGAQPEEEPAADASGAW